LAVSFRRLALETVASDWPLMQINSDLHFLPRNSDSETGYWFPQRAVAASCQSDFTGFRAFTDGAICLIAVSPRRKSR
jgi:hypothetical protein